MTQLIMSDSAPLILYGDDFPDEAIHVLNTMPDIEIIALVAETPAAMALSEFYDIPLKTFADLTELCAVALSSTHPLMCWLGSSERDNTDLVQNLMDKGLAILTTLPVSASCLTQWLRHSRQSVGRLSFFMPMLEHAVMQCFQTVARAWNTQAESQRITVRCSVSQLWPVVVTIHEVLGGIRRWNIVAVNALRPNEVQVDMKIGSVQMSLVLIQNVVRPADWPEHCCFESRAGTLTLTAFGAIECRPAGAVRALRLADECPESAGRDDQQSHLYQQIFTRWNEACHSDDRSLAETQRYLTLSRLVEALHEALSNNQFASNLDKAAQAEPTCPHESHSLISELMQSACLATDSVIQSCFRPDWGAAERAGSESVGGDSVEGMTYALRQLELLCLQVIKRFIVAVCDGAYDTGMTYQQIHTHIVPDQSHAWLVDRWLIALAKSGWLSNKGGLWYWTTLAEAEPEIELAEAYAVLGFPPTMADLHCVALQKLPELIRGQVSIQEIIFVMEQPMQALAAYQNNAVTACINTVSADLLEQWLTTYGTRNITVLEVGGGSGSFTQCHLPRLQGYLAHYCFTDVSRLFVDRAREHFPALDVSVLDINQNFSNQGIFPASIDILLAGNVLHNACNLEVTLRYMRRTLRLGGVLLLTDSIHDNAAMLTSMQFLLSPSNTEFANYPGGDGYRQEGEAFLSLAGWQAILPKTGFQLLGYFPESNHALAMSGQKVMLAVAV